MKRTQGGRCPERVDADSEEKTPGRWIDADGERLQLATLGLTPAGPQDTGRPCSTPADRRQWAIAGARQTMRSSRKGARATDRHVERMWLLRPRQPAFKTIAEVRHDQASALKAGCRACTRLCQTRDVCGQARIAMAGRTCHAVNRQDRHVTEPNRPQGLQHRHATIDTSRNACDQHETRESSGSTPPGEARPDHRAQ